MFVKPRKIEATLFYHKDPMLMMSQLAGDLVKAFSKTTTPMRPRCVTKTELGCTVGDLTFCFLRHAERAATPPLPNETETQHKSIAYTLRICGPEHAAKDSTRLALCYVGVMKTLNLARPDRIHWGYTNVIHTVESFLLESSGRHLRPNAGPLKRGPSKYAPERKTSIFRRCKPQAAASKGLALAREKMQSEDEFLRIFETIRSPKTYGISDRIHQLLPRALPE